MKSTTNEKNILQLMRQTNILTKNTQISLSQIQLMRDKYITT